MPGFQNKFSGPPFGFRGGPRNYGPGNGDGDLDPNSDQFRKLFIGGLSFDTDEESLKTYFSKWGEITDCIVMRETGSKRSRGFGFITFKSTESVDDVQSKRPHKVDEREVETKRAMPRDDPNMNNQLSVEKMFVGGLKEDTTEEMIRNAFQEFGNIKNIELITDKNTGKTKGFCFVTFDDYDPVDKLVLKKRMPLNTRKVEMKKAFAKGEIDPRNRMAMNMNMNMSMPMGRGGRGDFGFSGPGFGGGYGGYGHQSYGGGYGPSWQGYNEYANYSGNQGGPRFGNNFGGGHFGGHHGNHHGNHHGGHHGGHGGHHGGQGGFNRR